ncbi:hypothetical protein L1987_34487 [Smallanthus sonchifolius]|uniref:Uncharacterized protein n=1 Tax=Smallanthus sonchifolius TaxID=185202 RepID=A0ACB9HWJ6_9ASTR|nr:hypothetical protein L1987_34487 [Smallanthus sonchifolius]
MILPNQRNRLSKMEQSRRMINVLKSYGVAKKHSVHHLKYLPICFLDTTVPLTVLVLRSVEFLSLLGSAASN